MNSYLTTSIIETRPSEQSLVFNNLNKNINVASFLYRNLNECLNDSLTTEDCFYFSIAFITHAGLNNLLMQLKELSDRGLKGKILTTDYLTFTEPSALEKILSLKNIELKMFKATHLRGFHTKGYIFKRGEVTEIIIGSSNLTQSALFTNEEWNVQIRTSDNNSFYKQVRDEFFRLWNAPQSNFYENIQDNYQTIYTKKHYLRQKEKIKEQETIDNNDIDITPNSMQQGFISKLKELVAENKKKALLISPTGTGKTYAIALALKELNAKSVLFLVHRERIVKQALNSFAKIFKTKEKMGLVSGSSKEFDKNFVFSTLQTMASQDNYKRYLNKPFDYIVFDETHHLRAPSYYKTLENLVPNIMLIGMTATPNYPIEKGKPYFNIYDYYDHNVAYDLSFKKAIEENFLCTFHYFGIHELIDNSLNATTQNGQDIHTKKQINYVLENIKFFGIQDKNKLHGLVFCNSIKEAKIWCQDFIDNGYNCIYLTGETKEAERENAIDKLSREDNKKLDFIFTVDLFNEGIDIPCVNEIVMLRKTESSIVFTQQLGRGLRKYKDKEFCVIIDFIGNYQKNFEKLAALYGDKTYNRDKLLTTLLDDSNNFNSHFSIQIDKISKDRIYNSINNLNSEKINLKVKFDEFKDKLNRTPLFLDFIKDKNLDPYLYLEKFKSNYHMLDCYDEKFTKEHPLNELEQDYISYLSLILDRPKRELESQFLEFILSNTNSTNLINEFKNQYHYEDSHLVSLLNIFSGTFFNKQNIRFKIKPLPIITNTNKNIQINNDFLNCLQSSNFRLFLDDLISCNKFDIKNNYQNLYEDTPFVLYKSYKRLDALKLLNWEKDLNSVVNGYGSKNNDLVIFVHYDKNNIANVNLKYQDKFINNKELEWMSKNNQTTESKDVKKIIEVASNHMNIHLFVSKAKNTGTGGTYHLYLGKILKTSSAQNVKNGTNNVALLNLVLKTPLPDNIYEYLTM